MELRGLAENTFYVSLLDDLSSRRVLLRPVSTFAASVPSTLPFFSYPLILPLPLPDLW